MSVLPAITAPQGDTRVPKRFQASIIANLCQALQSPTRPPCLLRSPTGSGKTFMLTRVLAHISIAQPTLWMWFVPYVNLVAQTVDSLDSEGAGLMAVSLTAALNEEPAPSLVLVSTVQGVASAKARKSGYTSAEDDERRSIASYVARARAAGLSVGLVVDEAHIALDSATEFGQFVHWLQADYLLMASATPRDQRLSQFIETAGYSHFETFSVSRAEVVEARLNKQWLEAVVYDLRQSMQSVTDLKMTVLRRAWRRNQKIERDLRAQGLTTVPLMLVQVGNGKDAIDEAREFLMRELKVPPHAIGTHSADDPNPVMMAAIANDSTKQVLIFKQSAGTGFDAPRAFVLASTKHVNDPDFATQFIGRVMRVPAELQQAYPTASAVPTELNTAYIFLANEEAQPGFAEAAKAIQGVQSQLEGQIEQLVARRTAFGGVAITNKPTQQVPLIYNLGLLRTLGADGAVYGPELGAVQGFQTVQDGASTNQLAAASPFDGLAPGDSLGLFETSDDGVGSGVELGVDTVLINPVATGKTEKHPGSARRPARAPTSRDELFAALQEVDLQAIARRTVIAKTTLPLQLMTEVQPVFEVLALDVAEAARQLPIDNNTRSNAVKAALNRMTEKEIRTELFEGVVVEEDVQVITDQNALLEHTRDSLATLGLEDQDATDVIHTLALRLIDTVEQAWALQDEDSRPTATVMRRQARQAACWVIHKQFPELQETLHTQWANRAKQAWAQPLPDALLLPKAVTVLPSRKNIYGILYPAMGQTAAARDMLAPDSRRYFRPQDYVYGADPGENAEMVSLACVDGSYEFNESELKFAKALDQAEFVDWWHRNPHSKPFSVGLLRGDSKNLFYPDFVVCMTHMPGDAPLMRLVDPKHDTKDASRKAIHQSSFYGKVLFLTKDATRFKVVNDDGSVGDVVDFDDLTRLKQWMRQTQPSAQSTV